MSPRGALALTIENDFFTGTDNNYTNGFGLTWSSAEGRTYPAGSFSREWIDFWSFLPEIGDENCQTFASWTFGQEIFTPDDTTTEVAAPDDQPYSAVLFLDSSLYAVSERVTHAWNLRLGLVGPEAGGAQTQTQVHRAIGADEPRGWDAQLPTEPVLNVDYTLGYQWLRGALTDSANWRLVPMAGASVGNYFTGLDAALYMEFGWHMPASISLLSMRRGLDPFIDASLAQKEPWSLNFFLGGGGFAVGHYLPLDGTLFRDSASVRSKPLVGFASVGTTLRSGGFTVGYLLTLFTDTFETQRKSTDFGTLTLAWGF